MMKNLPIKLRKLLGVSSVGCAFGIGMLVFAPLIRAAEPAVPWECSYFGGEALNRCIRTYAELQQEKIARLEKDLARQQHNVQQLQQQIAEQASNTAALQRQLSRSRSAWYASPPIQAYPPFGLSLRLGRDRFWGGSLWYGSPRYWGPRWYGYGHRRWHRY